MKTNCLTKSVLDKFDVSDEAETEYCDNYLCENEAAKTVPVSVRRAGDSERKFCEACYEAYVIGVQHGRILAFSKMLLLSCIEDFQHGLPANPSPITQVRVWKKFKTRMQVDFFRPPAALKFPGEMNWKRFWNQTDEKMQLIPS